MRLIWLLTVALSWGTAASRGDAPGKTLLVRLTRPNLPIYLLHLATAHGLDLDYRPRDLERLVVTQAHAFPQSLGIFLKSGHIDIENTTTRIRRTDDGGWRVAKDGEQPHGQLTIGPEMSGATRSRGSTRSSSPSDRARRQTSSQS